MAAIPREKILARRRRLEAKQSKVKASMEKLRAEERRLATMVQEREDKKLKIIGKMMLERMEKDAELKAWFEQEIGKRLSNPRERELFF